ncbi:hypothetical protein ADT71_18195 [Novosphingobium sp. ST904]|nr:hypothetical protein ADT71_18195 [Novosphingobium sp. ST904]
MTADEALEDQHVLVLVIEHDVLELPVQTVFRTVERGRMPLGTDRAGGHQPVFPHLADPRILDPVALQAALRRDRAVVVDGDHVQPFGVEFDGQ